MIIALLAIGSFSAYCAVAVATFILHARQSLAGQARQEAAVEYRNKLRHERYNLRMSQLAQESKERMTIADMVFKASPDTFSSRYNDYGYRAAYLDKAYIPETEEKAPTVDMAYAILPAILWPFGVWFLIGITVLDKIRINARDQAKRNAEHNHLMEEAMQELGET